MLNTCIVLKYKLQLKRPLPLCFDYCAMILWWISLSTSSWSPLFLWPVLFCPAEWIFPCNSFRHRQFSSSPSFRMWSPPSSSFEISINHEFEEYSLEIVSPAASVGVLWLLPTTCPLFITSVNVWNLFPS